MLRGKGAERRGARRDVVEGGKAWSCGCGVSSVLAAQEAGEAPHRRDPLCGTHARDLPLPAATSLLPTRPPAPPPHVLFGLSSSSGTYESISFKLYIFFRITSALLLEITFSLCFFSSFSPITGRDMRRCGITQVHYTLQTSRVTDQKAIPSLTRGFVKFCLKPDDVRERPSMTRISEHSQRGDLQLVFCGLL